TGRPVRSWPEHSYPVSALAFAPDGRTLASTAIDGIRLWDVATGKAVGRVVGPEQRACHLLAFAPDGKTLASAHGDQVVRLWAPAPARPLHRPEAPAAEVSSVAFSPEGKVVVTGCFASPAEVRLWDSATGRPLRVLRGHRPYVRTVALTPDGKTVVSAGG